VTTTWNTSAADPKRAIARAAALIITPQSLLQKQAERTKRKARKFARSRSWGSWQKVTYLAFTNNRADCRARSTDFVAMLRRARILGSHPYRLRRVSRSARRLSVRQSGSPHHPVARRRPSCVMPRIASPNSRTCAAPSGLMQRIRPAFSRASSASILIRRCHPRGFAESHGFRSRSPNPVRHPTSPPHPPMSRRLHLQAGRLRQPEGGRA